MVGQFVELDGMVYLIATIQMKNVGSSRIDFDGDASALILFEYVASTAAAVHAVTDKRLTSFAMFGAQKERYVEPNETVEVQRFILIPGPPKLAYRLEADIFSISGFTWRAMSIVDKTCLRDNVAD